MCISEALRAVSFDRLDTEVLLAHVLHKDRSWLLAHPEQVLSSEEESSFRAFIARRTSGEPVAYIVGEKEFYGRNFFVDRRVLIPRPATEGLVDLALNVLDQNFQFSIFNFPSIYNAQFPITKQLDTDIVGMYVPFPGKQKKLKTVN